MGSLVDKLLKCGITLADYYSLAVEDEDADAQEMGFEDADDMLDQVPSHVPAAPAPARAALAQLCASGAKRSRR